MTRGVDLLNLGLSQGLMTFAILFVGYYFDRSPEVGICCLIMGAMTIFGLWVKVMKEKT